MKVLVTGSKGFVGKNLCSVLALRGDIELLEFDLGNTPEELQSAALAADFIIHLAGVNRPLSQDEFLTGNAGLTSDIVNILKGAGKKTPLLLSSSTQAALDNPYGRSKKLAEDVAFDYGRTGAPVYVYRFTNLFGKWCRPNYNSVVATFCFNIANDLPIQINDPDHVLRLAYIDDVVEEIVSALGGSARVRADGYCYLKREFEITLGALAELIRSFRDIREARVIPDMSDQFTKFLHSTYLSYLEERQGFAYPALMHADNRGWLFELIKSPAAGQIFVSRTKPGITRGNHYHHTKVEKFVVIEGEAVISFRKIDSDEVIEYPVSGEHIQIVDIPPGYTHAIKNTGDTDVITLFWSCEMFDPEKPDTVYLEV